MDKQALSEEEKIAAEAWPEIQKQARGQAELLGPAPRTTPLIGEAEVERWNAIAPQFEGIDARQIAEEMKLTPAGATLLKYPFRGPMLLSGNLEPNEQIRYAKEMERRSQHWRMRQAERGNERLQDLTLPSHLGGPAPEEV